MPRAEVGSNKYVANKMKSAGLQRLRWWCEICAKQCRDANGFKCHVQSESHVRQMQVVGENPQKYIKQFSDDFQHDFIALLRVAHGEKWINANKFYQQYIAAKEHVHMNATRWNSLTEFVKYLGREGIVRVRESESDKDKNMSMEIAWKDTSAAAVKRREEIREIELAEARSGAGEDKMLKKMARRAQSEADEKARILEARKAAKQDSASPLAPGSSTSPSAAPTNEKKDSDESSKDASGADGQAPVSAAPVKISFGLKAKVLPPAQMKKTQSVFKRARGDKESEEKPKKKLKL